MADHRAITGVWKLRSFNLYLAGNPAGDPIMQPLGENPAGRLVLTDENYMNATITSAEATKSSITAPNWIHASDDEIAGIARSMTTYCGYFTLSEEEGKNLLSTQVEISLDPSWIGKPQVRSWELSHEEGKPILTLRPVQEFTLPNGVKAVAALIWEKLSPKSAGPQL